MMWDLLALTLLVRIPAMVDYPDHLALDLIIPRLARLVGVAPAARIFVLVAQILIGGDAMAVERVVKGRVSLPGSPA